MALKSGSTDVRYGSYAAVGHLLESGPLMRLHMGFDMPAPTKLFAIFSLLLASCAHNSEIAEGRMEHVRIEPLGDSDKPMPVIILFDRETPEPPFASLELARQLSQHRIVVSSERLGRAFRFSRDVCSRNGTRMENRFGDVGVSGGSSRLGSFRCRLGPAATCAYLYDLKDRNSDQTALLDAIRDMRLRLGCIGLGDEGGPRQAFR